MVPLILSLIWRLYMTGFGFVIGFIAHLQLNYSVYPLQLTTTESSWTLSTTTESPWTLSVSQLTTNSAESLARAQDLLQTHFTVSELSTQTALPVAS
jgi:hypothetical protein